MKLGKQNILFFTRTMKLGGTENIVLQLCETFKPLVNNIVVCSCGGVNVHKLSALGVKHYTIPDIEDKKLKQVLMVIKEVKKIIKHENITIIHTHHRMASFYVAMLKLYKKCLFINTCHNTFENKKKLTQYAYKHCNLIACGELVKRNLIKTFKISDKQIKVITNAVTSFDDEVIWDERLEELKKEGYFLVGNIGRLSEQKGMEYFIKSFMHLKDHAPHTKYIIVGTGELERDLKQLVADLELSNDIIFMGYRSDIQNIIAQLDMVVISSLWEGLPLTPIEAFSVGKAVIGTAVDGTVEVINDNVNGFLIQPENAQAIAQKLTYLMENPLVLEEFQKAAYETYNQNFRIDYWQKKYIKYYLEVINNNEQNIIRT